MKTAIVTGSTKGIGRNIAMALIARGCKVVLNYANDDETAQALGEELHSDKCEFSIVKADLSQLDTVREFTGQAISFLGSHGLDFLIINAGITAKEPFGDITFDAWQRVMDVNLNIPFFLVQAFHPYLKDNGRIIFIGSVLGKYPHSVSIPYGVSKAGLHFLTKMLVKEVANKRVTVNCICPGFVDTPWQVTKTQAHRARIEDKIALHRFALPEEIAQCVMSVIDNDYINGTVLEIDGGYCYR